MTPIEAELRLAIRRALVKCSPDSTPRFCEMIKTKQGYRKAEEMIIHYAIKNQTSIGATITHLEMEL